MRTSGPSRPSGRRSVSTRKARPARSTHRAGRPLEALDVAVADEHQVDVAGVVELGATELAHADDRQPVVLAEDVAGRVDDDARGRPWPGRRARRWWPRRSSTPVRSRAAMRSSSRRFHVTRSPRPAGGSVRGASGAQHRRAPRRRSPAPGPGCGWPPARRRAARPPPRDRRGGCGRRSRAARTRAGSAERSTSSSITGGAAPAAPRARRSGRPSSSSPRRPGRGSRSRRRRPGTTPRSASRSTPITSADDLEPLGERGGGIDGGAADRVGSRAEDRRRRGRRPSASGRWRATARARPPARWWG